jgi:hypothetical protein
VPAGGHPALAARDGGLGVRRRERREEGQDDPGATIANRGGPVESVPSNATKEREKPMKRAALCTLCLLAALLVGQPSHAQAHPNATPAAAAATSAPVAPEIAALFATAPNQPMAPFLAPAPSHDIACATVVCVAPCHCVSPKQAYCANLERCICGCR